MLNLERFAFTVTPEIQDWSNENILSKVLALGLSKIAFVVAVDVFVQVAVELQIEDNPNALNITRYFDDEAKARLWLNQKN